jgi:hypothetical protein
MSSRILKAVCCKVELHNIKNSLFPRLNIYRFLCGEKTLRRFREEHKYLTITLTTTCKYDSRELLLSEIMTFMMAFVRHDIFRQLFCYFSESYVASSSKKYPCLTHSLTPTLPVFMLCGTASGTVIGSIISLAEYP